MVLEEQRPEDGFALLTATDPGYSIAPSHQPESSMALTFEWDPQKAARNHSKHGVAFEEAASAARLATSRERKSYEKDADIET